jgi:hypothetical protein
MSELKREIRDLKDELRDLRALVAALVARSGGEVVVTADELLRVDTRVRVVVIDEPADASARELIRIRLETP